MVQRGKQQVVPPPLFLMLPLPLPFVFPPMLIPSQLPPALLFFWTGQGGALAITFAFIADATYALTLGFTASKHVILWDLSGQGKTNLILPTLTP
jgi:hypothetical protein